MKTLYKTSDVIRFLVKFDCSLTADSIKEKAGSAEFLDSELVRKELIWEIYRELDFELCKYTYVQK